jgi:two-component system chemotaxis response regulator CheB
MIRVLVAEDSATVRTLLVAVLNSDPEIQVVGEACDGVEAVALTQHLRPDLVTMDVRMPRMDGLAATKEIMIAAPTPIVIVSGSTQLHDTESAMHALRCGALAVLGKPPGPESPAFEEAARQLVATVKAMAQVKVVRHWRPRVRPTGPPVLDAPRATVVAVATSTGGPAALNQVLGDLPGDFPLPILVVQHITPGFVPGLAAWLNTVCDLRVKEAEPGELLAPRTVYLAPDGRHLGVTGRSVALSDAAPVGGFQPSATVLFESVARAYGAGTVALILTGMGEDGVEGLRAVRRVGGTVIAQDEQSSVVFGMPGAAIAAGLADTSLSIKAIAPRLVKYACPHGAGKGDDS